MLFYEINDELIETVPEKIDPDTLTVGCVSSEELMYCGRDLGFDDETIETSQKASPLFRTGVDVHERYTFAELRIVNRDGHEDSVSVFIKRNLLLIVDIFDEDDSTINCFLKATRKYPCSKTSLERILFCFIDSLLADGNMTVEEIRNNLTDMEETIVTETTEDDFHIGLLEQKKRILKYTNFYEQIRDVTETLEENENEILNEDNLIYITNLINKVTRLVDDMNLLSNTADHIQDAYASLLDQRMNNTMKIFTIITTIFFPLTIIVGWYGMNFRYMPELSWKYGYVFVILLSILVVSMLYLFGKKKKWF